MECLLLVNASTPTQPTQPTSLTASRLILLNARRDRPPSSHAWASMGSHMLRLGHLHNFELHHCCLLTRGPVNPSQTWRRTFSRHRAMGWTRQARQRQTILLNPSRGKLGLRAHPNYCIRSVTWPMVCIQNHHSIVRYFRRENEIHCDSSTTE
jgi:hypothetical protein